MKKKFLVKNEFLRATEHYCITVKNLYVLCWQWWWLFLNLKAFSPLDSSPSTWSQKHDQRILNALTMQRDEFVIENEWRRSFTIDFSYETLSIADLFKFVQTVQKLTLFKIYNSLDGRRNVTRCIKPSAETLGKLSKKRASSRRDLPTNPFPTHKQHSLHHQMYC